MVSMKDIAAACGVSVATVSKALNNHSDISDETKAVIKQKAREMGYHPNFSARALKTNKSYNIGVLYKDDAGSGLTHDYFAWVLENFKVTAENNGYDITFLNNSRLKKDRMSYLEHSIYRGMDGVMIAIADYKNPEVIELLQGELPVVTIDYVYNGRISIMSDNVEGMQALLQYAYDKGHRRIAVILLGWSAGELNEITLTVFFGSKAYISGILIVKNLKNSAVFTQKTEIKGAF